MRQARLEGRQIGRRPLDIDRAVLRDRDRGLSLAQVAKAYGISRAMVSKIVCEQRQPPSHEGFAPAPLQIRKTGSRIRQPELVTKQWVPIHLTHSVREAECMAVAFADGPTNTGSSIAWSAVLWLVCQLVVIDMERPRHTRKCLVPRQGELL
jgi:hypothetical protein